MNVIRSHKHEIFTEEINKVALNGNDDKRIIMADRIRTMAYGHYSIGSENMKCVVKIFGRLSADKKNNSVSGFSASRP